MKPALKEACDLTEKPALHLAFGMSAAGSIGQALRQLGCRDRVIGFVDDLSFGPIDPPDAKARGAWADEALFVGYDEIPHMAELFWEAAASPDIVPVAWVCRNHASEYAGFLEFVRRMADARYRVVDASDVRIPQWHRPGRPSALWSLNVATPDQLAAAGLLQMQKTLSSVERKAYRTRWELLRAENASFRIVDESGLVSAPLTYFDEVTLSCVTGEWQKGARVVGETMAALTERPYSQCPGDMILWSRVRAMAGSGVVELRGSETDIRASEVRRATR